MVQLYQVQYRQRITNYTRNIFFQLMLGEALLYLHVGKAHDELVTW
jgi:hypothetical protein